MKKLLRFSFLSILISLSGMTAGAEDLTPEIIFPKPDADCILSGISDNGRWGVQGSSIVDLSTQPFTFRNIGGSCRDISDDGKTVVGSSGGPAVWKEGIGWQRLPIPKGGQGGSASKVTPDGRYAVGTVGLGIVNTSDGVMWDLETLSIVELPEKPLEDRAAHTPFPNNYQNQYDNISSDGRYVLGTLAWSYVGEQTAYVYDRNTDETHYIGYTKNSDGTFTPKDPVIHFTECENMSSDGHYVTGPVYILKGEEYLAAYRYDVWNDTLEYFDKDEQPDAWGFAVSNDGLVFLRKGAQDPYSEGYVCYDGFYYSIRDILTIGYDINLERYGIDNTGNPYLCSSDGRTICLINSPQSSYVLRFKEDLKDVCRRLNLLKNWKSTPRDGATVGRISNISIDFSYPVEASSVDYNKVGLYDDNGNLIATPLAQGGLYADGNALKIVFRTVPLTPDMNYTLKIPQGICHVKGLPENVNNEISLSLTGRKEGPVSVARITPESGSVLNSLSMQSDPIFVTFDSDIIQNTNMDEQIKIYIDDNPNPYAYLYASKYDDRTLALYPLNELPLYEGSSYVIKVPENLVTDLAGYGASEAFEINYVGNYIPTFSNDQYIFKSECDSWDNFMFYEGDYGTPTSEYLGMGFTADTTPWWVVRDNIDSTDMAFASHSCYTDGRQSNDWAVTRQMYIPDETAFLEFDGQSYRRNKEDILKVFVYASETMINSLTEMTVKEFEELGDLVFEERLDPGATEGGMDNEWTHYEVPLAKYSGKNIYIAFVNQNKNQSMVMIDNVTVARRLDSFISLSTPSSVVALDEVEIKGYIVVDNAPSSYSSVDMKLKSDSGDVISTLSATGLDINPGDSWQFAFPESLPLTVGEENKFTIEFSLDDDQNAYYGSIKDLSFEPVKRVVLEEFTGRDCQYCPEGIVMVDLLSRTFPDNFIPIALHCYNGTDPKGLNVMDYWQFLNMSLAPTARINRRNASAAFDYITSIGKYVYTASQYPDYSVGALWFDEVVSELEVPTFLDLNVVPVGGDASRLSYRAEVRSAIHLENQNIRVFGVLLENGLEDYQVNGIYGIEEPLFGEWGKGGSLASSRVMTTFDHVAKGTWGNSYNGTANLIPVSLNPYETYNVDMEIRVPSDVRDVNNCDFVVILIDGNTGKIINAAISGEAAGINSSLADDGSVTVTSTEGTIKVVAQGEARVSAYSPAGLLLASGSGTDEFSLNLNGYRGVVIVNVETSKGKVVRKLAI